MLITRQVPFTLVNLCLDKLVHILQDTNYHPQQINELCKILSNFQHLLDPILVQLLERKVITDVALIAFLVPERRQLICPGVINIKNSTLKMIGYNCLHLRTLNLSDCQQVSNSVVRSILHGCSHLQELILNRCHRITDSAFDPLSSPFELLHGCLSLETISLQGCNQITGHLTSLILKQCHLLKDLNLSQCKRISSPDLKHIFCYPQLKSLHLLFTDLVSDETFSLLPAVSIPQQENSNIPLSKHDRYSPYFSLLFGGGTATNHQDLIVTPQLPPSPSIPPPLSPTPAPTPPQSSPMCELQSLSIGMSSITDTTLYRIASLSNSLIELHLQWCSHITDSGIHILVSFCQHLQLLNLKSCSQLTDQTLSSIGKECHMIQHLDISWCSEITDTGLLHLIPEGKGDCLLLKNLSLSWCPLVTLSSLTILFSQLSNLHSIDLSGCNGLTSDCIATLQKCRNEVVINS